MTVVTRRSGRIDRALALDDIVIAVEVESPSSITMDRLVKPDRYARAGIPHYWRVETQPIQLAIYQLVDGAYVETGSGGVDDIIRVREPFTADLDLSGLGSRVPRNAG